MEALKVLGQAAPAANTTTDLYAVPASTSIAASTIIVCNQTAASIKFRISVAVAGAALATKQYIYYDVVVLKSDSFTATIGIALAATDVIRVHTDTANVSFNLFGCEVT
jgi:hypothetical protein